jgi:1-pyrroline-5-carboxylate dehydrogenase
MQDLVAAVPAAINEPTLSYAPGTAERSALKAALGKVASEIIEIPCVIGGQRYTTGRFHDVVMPHNHRQVIARFHCADAGLAQQAVNAALAARRAWADMRWEARAAIFLKAADLLAGPWRARINACTMHGQSKTAHQSEIDAACELIDFWRIGVSQAHQLYQMQPMSAPGMWNMMELRPLEGFVFALTPFNFTAIAANLPSVPALMGNVVVWKPAESQTLAAWETFQLLEEAGLPPGVINFLPGLGHELSPVLLDHPELAALSFTGSTDVFRSLWKHTSNNLERYKNYPRLVGETGGKDFIVAHPSADPRALTAAIIRGGFEYQGQKCSAASRVYIAKSVWDKMGDDLIAQINGIKMGRVDDFTNFMGAVIKQNAFDRHAAAISEARTTAGMAVAAGGQTDDKDGWFVRPTLLTTDNPHVRHMRDEFFGPIVTAHIYPDTAWDDILPIIDKTSAYALTGAVFARERAALMHAAAELRHAAGNFYFNDKPTGAVVGQQPFGGARASGTDDKAGSPFNLLRFVAPRTIKETFVPVTDYRYSFMNEP